MLNAKQGHADLCIMDHTMPGTHLHAMRRKPPNLSQKLNETCSVLSETIRLAGLGCQFSVQNTAKTDIYE